MNNAIEGQKIFPDWIRTLKGQDLSDTHFILFNEENFVPAFSATSLTKIGESSVFSDDRRIVLGFDESTPDQLIASMDNFSAHSCFSISPTVSALEAVFRSLVAPGTAIPDIPDDATAETMHRDMEVISLKTSQKRETIVFLGLGNWDDMADLEQRLRANRYTSNYPMAMATAPGRDGAASQFYSAFSASLCSLIRSRSLGKTLFYMHVEYLPSPVNHMRSMKTREPDNFFVRTLPNDLPLDVVAMLLTGNTRQETMPQLIEDVHNDNFESLQILEVLARLSGKFDDVFALLASHPNQQFRDHIALEAATIRSHNIVAAVMRYGVSPDVQKQLSRM